MYKGCRSPDEADRAGFPCSEYEFPADGIAFKGKLVFKKWGKNTNLICYFDTAAGERRKLCVYFSSDDKRTYRPKRSDTNMKEMPLGTEWEITYHITNNKKTMWLTANEINRIYPDADESSKLQLE